VVDGGEGEVVIQKFSEFSGKCRCELGTMIRDDFVIESEVKKDFVEEEGGDAFSKDSFLSWAENYPLSKLIVYHDQKGIKARGGGEISDQIIEDLLERSSG